MRDSIKRVTAKSDDGLLELAGWYDDTHVAVGETYIAMEFRTSIYEREGENTG